MFAGNDLVNMKHNLPEYQMKSIRLLTSSIIWLSVVAAIISVNAVAFEGAVTAQAVDGEARMTTRSPVSELSWTEVSKGRSVSPVYGDMKTGKHITFIRFAPGMKTVPHTHSNDYVGIVVKGTARHFQPGFPETETVLPAGSHWAIPGEVVHISECLPGSECVFAIYQEAPFDRKPVK